MARQWFAEGVQVYEQSDREFFAEGVQVAENQGGGAPPVDASLNWFPETVAPTPDDEHDDELVIPAESVLLDFSTPAPATVDLSWLVLGDRPADDDQAIPTAAITEPASDQRKLLDWFVEFSQPQRAEETITAADFELPLSDIVPSDWLPEMLAPVLDEEPSAEPQSLLATPPEMPYEAWLPVETALPDFTAEEFAIDGGNVLTELDMAPVEVPNFLLVPNNDPPQEYEPGHYDGIAADLLLEIIVPPSLIVGYRIIAAGWFRPGAEAAGATKDRGDQSV